MTTDGDIAHAKIMAMRTERAARIVRQKMLIGMRVSQVHDYARGWGLRVNVIKDDRRVVHYPPRTDRLNVMIDPATDKVVEAYVG